MDTQLFQNGINTLGLEVTAEQLKQFEQYSALLVDWNTKMNLTAITDDAGIAVKHFLDSILPLAHIAVPQSAKVADIGTGAGFPGLPIKIMRPDLSLTLIDSLNKRVSFLKETTAQLRLQKVESIHGRAEELGRDKQYRAMYDMVFSRAVANLAALSEYCLPFIRKGGMFVALKASDLDEELESAREIIRKLGGEIRGVLDAPLPESDIVRKLVVIDKVFPTPPQYPRSAKRIKQA